MPFGNPGPNDCDIGGFISVRRSRNVLECSSPLELWPKAGLGNQRLHWLLLRPCLWADVSRLARKTSAGRKTMIAYVDRPGCVPKRRRAAALHDAGALSASAAHREARGLRRHVAALGCRAIPILVPRTGRHVSLFPPRLPIVVLGQKATPCRHTPRGFRRSRQRLGVLQPPGALAQGGSW